MKRFCELLREQTMKIDFKKKKMKLLTKEQEKLFEKLLFKNLFYL